MYLLMYDILMKDARVRYAARTSCNTNIRVRCYPTHERPSAEVERSRNLAQGPPLNRTDQGKR